MTDKVTATTIMFRFVAPTNTGGLPIESYAVEYKETTQQWQDARRRVWPSSKTYFMLRNGWINKCFIEVKEVTCLPDYFVAAGQGKNKRSSLQHLFYKNVGLDTMLANFAQREQFDVRVSIDSKANKRKGENVLQNTFFCLHLIRMNKSWIAKQIRISVSLKTSYR